jgi:hypothetical protein
MRHYDHFLDTVKLGGADSAVVEDMGVPVSALVVWPDGDPLWKKVVDCIQSSAYVVCQFDAVVKGDEIWEGAVEVLRQFQFSLNL